MDVFIPGQVGVIPGLWEAVQAQAIHQELVIIAQANNLQGVMVLRPWSGVLPHNAVNNLSTPSVGTKTG